MEDQCFSVLLIDSDNSDFEFDNEDSSSDEEDEVFILAYLNAPVKDKRKIPRITNYIDGTINKHNAHEFKTHFRMFPDTFEYVLGLIGHRFKKKIMDTGITFGRKPIDAKKQLLIALWMMALPDCYRSVCEKFDVGLATALRSVRRVSYTLHSLAPQFIRWPRGEHAREVAREFERHSAFPGVVGAIGGTHIKVNAPTKDGQSYINRKGTHSIQMQAVCTHYIVLTSVFGGYAGSVHDARVFRLSPVQNFIQNPDQYFEVDSHIIGDAAYGVHRHIMVPFKNNGHLSPRQNNLNFCLSSARIERAFGLWKTRWRKILDCLPMVTGKKIPEYLLALAVLHNICILQRDLIPIEEESLRVGQRGRLIVDGREEGMRKRQILCNNFVLRSV
ncbi:hypothetical protein ABMA27_003364 [Loxostege sticticalis]|uniref:Putative nuclease HARBI1 n=1 Tax=Loxostege sticticalis TaxID=481309 RepID=A0ABR3HT20_LOXSC